MWVCVRTSTYVLPQGVSTQHVICMASLNFVHAVSNDPLHLIDQNIAVTLAGLEQHCYCCWSRTILLLLPVPNNTVTVAGPKQYCYCCWSQTILLLVLNNTVTVPEQYCYCSRTILLPVPNDTVTVTGPEEYCYCCRSRTVLLLLLVPNDTAACPK